MRLKELEGILQQVETFQSPKVQLEQYATSAQLASHILFTAEETYGDVKDKVVGDLGCGSGVFAIGARCLEAGYCVGFDIDEEALALAVQNLADFDMDRVELVRCDVTIDEVEVDDDDSDSESESEDDESEGDAEHEAPSATAACSDSDAGTTAVASTDEVSVDATAAAAATSPPVCGQWRRFSKQFDTMFLNPPFGTKCNTGIDMAFLRRAVQLSRGAVYSLHKSSTRKYIAQLAEREMHVTGSVVAEMKFNLPKTYKFHRKKSVDVAVDLWRFDCSGTGSRS